MWLIALALFYVAWCALLVFAQRSMMFPRHAAGQAGPVPAGVEIIAVEIDGPAMTVPSWYCAAPVEAPRALVVFAHGNAELADHQRDLVEQYHELACDVLVLEYRGYGDAAGTPSQAGIVADGVAALDLVSARPRLLDVPTIFHGRSLGGAVAAQLAAQRPPDGLIVQSTFTHTGAFAARYLVPPFLVRDPFATRDVLPTLSCPIVIFHGTADRVIPFAHAERLAEVAPAAELIRFDGVGHNTMPGSANEPIYWERIAQLVTQIERASRR